jgi:hypothetical protein
MATREQEITEDVDLCMSGGRHLAPSARGWSRVPLHTANLAGRRGRTKAWDYWAILAGDLVASVTYADVDYLGIADVWWADLPSGRTGGRNVTVPLARGIALPDRPGSAPLRFNGRRLRLALIDDADGTHFRAGWTERDGTPAHLEATVGLPPGHESLNVVIPWSDTLFQYTSKHQARPVRGRLVVGDEEREFGTDGDGEAWGVLDVGRGRWPYRTNWNWGGGAGRSTDGRVIGLQLGGKWTEGTRFTENGFLVDGRLTKVGDELTWDYRWDAPLTPWRVQAPDGSIDVTLAPRYDKHTRIQAGVMGMEVHQVFGHWSGRVCTDDGEEHRFHGLQGFAEESRSRW